MKALRRYLRVGDSTDNTEGFWLTDGGEPLTYWGGMGIVRRLKARSGVERIHPHLLRHTFAQNAIEQGAERAVFQVMLGHKTAEMTRRDAGSVGRQADVRQMPGYSPT